MKKIRPLFMAIAVVVLIFVAQALPLEANAITAGDYTYTYSLSTYKATITGYTGTGGDITIPSRLDGYEVTAIRFSAFKGCSSLINVTIPDSVTSIGDYAFQNCTNLTSVTIPNSVTSIGNLAFGNCTSLTSITIPGSVADMSGYAFDDCPIKKLIIADGSKTANIGSALRASTLQEVVIPDSVTSIGENAFYNCASLTSITIPDSVTSIGDHAFSGCASLTNIVIPDSVVSIGENAFYNCASLTSITIPDSVTSIGDRAFWNCASLTRLIIGNGVTRIGIAAFCGCDGLTDITIPDSVTSIGDSAFFGCDGLTSVTIGNGVTSIGEEAFYKCTNLTSVIIGNSVTSIGDSAFYNCSSLASITIPDSVTIIARWAFYACSNLTSVTIGNGVTSIGICAFEDCSSLTSVTIGNGVTSIYKGAFKNCSGLTSIIIPDGVTSIGEEAFYKCTSLASIAIPDSVVSIGADAFAYAYNLRTVIYCGTQKQWDAIDYMDFTIGALDDVLVFHNITSGVCTFCGYKTVYTVTFKDWNGRVLKTTGYYYGDVVVAPPNPTRAATNTYTYAFAGWDKTVTACYGNKTYTATYTATYAPGLIYLSFVLNADGGSYYVSKCDTSATGKVIIPATYEGKPVTKIGDYAFNNCSNLTNITIPDSVTTIGYGAFSGCSNLTSVIIGNCVSTIGDAAFRNCTSLIAVTIPAQVTSIGNFAFEDCTSLNSITIPNSTNTIGQHAFAGCTNLTSVTIPDSVTSVGAYLFENCTGLTSVTIGNGLTDINKGMFSGCSSLTSVTIPNSVTTIGGSAFHNCTGLTSVIIGNGVTTIGDSAFYNCNKLKFVLYRGTQDAWDSITINYFNDELLDATLICEFAGDSVEDATYTVTFKDWDGTVLSSATYHLGDAITVPADPTRDADNARTYIFDGWDSPVVSCAGDATYTATYIVNDINYVIVFKDWDGTELSYWTYHWGEEVIAYDTPTRDPDNTYTYTFVGWDKEIVNCAGDATYTAVYEATYIDYTAVYKDWDGTVLSTLIYHWGDELTAPANPARPADNTYTYSFAGWNVDFVDAGGTTTHYLATYTSTYIDYTVVFKDWDGTILSSGTYHCGESVIIPAKPTRSADNTFTYTFAGWDDYVSACTGNATYTATYTSTYINYKVIFKNWDGKAILTQNYHWGDTITVPGTPTKKADDTYTYTFAGWDKEVVTSCAGEATYTATFTPVYIDYTVVFKDWDGTVISTKTYHYGDEITVPANPVKEGSHIETFKFYGWSGNLDFISRDNDDVVICSGNETYVASYSSDYVVYTVVFKDWNGTVISTNTYWWGDPIVVPANPTRAADNTYTYAFKDWGNAVVNCAGDATYTAQYTATYREYAITFKNWDGTVLSTKTYHYGDRVTAPTNPTKAADNTYTYAFKSWDRAVVNCAGNATYTATYTSTYIDYTVVFKNWDGTVLSAKTYHYGDAVTAPANPTRPDDDTYTYTFIGWDKTVATTCNGNATYTAVYSKVTRVPSAITSPTYTISNGTISKIATGTTVDALLGKLNEGEYVKVYNGTTEVAKDTLIGTGMVVKIMDGDTEKVSVTVVVTGDTNGDGKITVTDYVQLKSHLLNKSTLTGAAAQAADSSGDGKATVTDYVQIKAHILGKSSVEPKSVTTVPTKQVRTMTRGAEVPLAAEVPETTATVVAIDVLLPEKKTVFSV